MSEIEHLIKKEKHHRKLRRSFFSYIFPIQQSSSTESPDLPPETGYASTSHSASPPSHATLQIYDNDQTSLEDSMLVQVSELQDPNSLDIDDDSLVPQVPEYLDPNTLDPQESNQFLTWPRLRQRTSPRKSSLPARLDTDFIRSVSEHSQELTYSSNRLVVSNRSDTDDEHVDYSEYLRSMLDLERRLKYQRVMCYVAGFAAVVIVICFIAAVWKAVRKQPGVS